MTIWQYVSLTVRWNYSSIPRMRKVIFGIMLALVCTMGTQGAMRVASLHPLLSDMARQVGGDAVEVIDLFPPNSDLHSFEPTTADIAAATGAKLLLACGKGVEPYLDDLEDSLPDYTRIVELGSAVPDAYLPGSTIADPHWWNSPAAMKRASRTLRAALEAALPGKKSTFTKGQRSYSAQMDQLSREAKLAFAAIPQHRRVLVSSHAAMSHFCKEFGFKAIAIHGIAKESEGDTASLAHILSQLRENAVPCLFHGANEPPKVLQTIAKQVGATTRPLAMDGILSETPSYAELFRFNIKNITGGLLMQSGNAK